jgi:transglutaminase-like putative cysteine protease
MARPQGTTARLQRLTSLLATVLVAVATAVAFARVFQGRAATWQLVFVGLASAAVAWAFERRSLLLATSASAALLVVTIGLVVMGETTWYGLPTLELLRSIGTAAAAVGEQARIQVSPTPPVDALLLAGVTAVWASVFSCHALAFRAGSPLLALVPPVALVAFADTVLEEFVKPQYGLLFLLAALAVVFTDGLRRVQGWGPVWTRPGGRDRLVWSAGRGARRIAVAAMALGVAAPLLMPGFGANGLIDLSSVNSSDRISVAPLVSISAQLNRDTPVEVFTVNVSAGEPQYWRMLTLDRYNDVSWDASTTTPTPIDAGTQLPYPEVGGVIVDQEFTISNSLNFTWLPAAPNAMNVVIDEDLSYNPETAAVSVDAPLDAGATYRVASLVPGPDPAELHAATLVNFESDAKYVQLPADLPDAIENIARDVIGGAPDDYAKVLAIQNYLRDKFTYDPTVEPEDDPKALVTFLKDEQAGFCQQFASAMAVMLRTIQIPSRVAMGFTSGSIDEDGLGLSVTTEELHSWVEVLFPTYGWLAFEPTPGQAVQGYQTSTTDVPCLTGRCPSGGPNATDGNTGITGPAGPGKPRPKFGAPPRRTEDLLGRDSVRSGNGGAGADPERGPAPARVLAVAGIVGALVLIGVPIVRVAGRRRRLRRAGREPRRRILATYDVFTERAADLGLGREVGETPEEYRRRVRSLGHVSDGHLDRLTGLAVRAAYGPDEPGGSDVDDATADADQALRELRKRTPMARRLVGIYRRD